LVKHELFARYWQHNILIFTLNGLCALILRINRILFLGIQMKTTTNRTLLISSENVEKWGLVIQERSHYEPGKIIINFDENYDRYRYHAMAASDLSAHGKQPDIFKRYTGSYLRRMYDICLVGFI
jgi:hypothetical protein